MAAQSPGGSVALSPLRVGVADALNCEVTLRRLRRLSPIAAISVGPAIVVGVGFRAIGEEINVFSPEPYVPSAPSRACCGDAGKDAERGCDVATIPLLSP